MSTPEILNEANRLADVVKTSPDKVKQNIANATMDQLDFLAKIVDEQKIAVQENALAAIRERMEQINQTVDVDKRLAGLENKLNLVRLLGIKAPETPEVPSATSTVTSFLRGAADMTKNVPGLGWLMSNFQGMKSRTIERMWNTTLSLFEKNPSLASNMGGMVLGAPGMLLGMFGLNFGARRRLLELDMLDGIDNERLLGEKITLKPIDAADLEKHKDKLATANLTVLTSEFIKNRRAVTAPGTPIEISIADVLDTEKMKAALTNQTETVKKNRIAEQWKAFNVTSVNFGAPVGAKKNGAGAWEVTVPEAQLADGKPNSPETRKLQEALPVLPAAKDIVIVGENENLALDLQTKSVKLPLNAVVTGSLDRGLAASHPRLTKIVFASPAELPIGKMQAKFDSGTLLLSSNAARIQSLDQLAGLDQHLNDAANGAIFEFKNGNWTLPPTAKPLLAF